MTIPTAIETWPLETASSARPPVIQPTALHPSCWTVLRRATSLFGYHPMLYLPTEICRKPVAAPKVAQKPLTAPPKIDAKMHMRIACFNESPKYSQPRNPVAKHDTFIVPDAQRRAIVACECHVAGSRSSGSLRSIACDSTPNFLSIFASRFRSFESMPLSCFTGVLLYSIICVLSEPRESTSTVVAASFSSVVIGRSAFSGAAILSSVGRP